VVAMKDGAIRAQGPPAEVFTPDTLADVHEWPCHVIPDPVHGTPLVIPLDASGASGPSAPAGRVTTTTENQEMLP
jgi:iron complex transport system ATP-binding protein